MMDSRDALESLFDGSFSSIKDSIDLISNNYATCSRADLWAHRLRPYAIDYARTYQRLANAASKCDAEIIKDVTRTYPADVLFQTASSQMKMFHVTRAYCATDARVGYCQGMCFPVGALLKSFDETTAFANLSYIFKNLKMRHLFQVEHFSLKITKRLFCAALLRLAPTVARQIESTGYDLQVLLIPWTLSLTGSFFAISGVAEVLDLILLFGPTALFSLLLALLVTFADDVASLETANEFHSFFRYRLAELYTQHKQRVLAALVPIVAARPFAPLEKELGQAEKSCEQDDDNEGKSGPAATAQPAAGTVELHGLAAPELLKLTDALANLCLALCTENAKLKSSLFILPDLRARPPRTLGCPRDDQSAGSSLPNSLQSGPNETNGGCQEEASAHSQRDVCTICKIKQLELTNKINQMDSFFGHLSRITTHVKTILETLRQSQSVAARRQPMNPYKLYEELLDSSAGEAKAKVKIILLEDELLQIEAKHLRHLGK